MVPSANVLSKRARRRSRSPIWRSIAACRLRCASLVSLHAAMASRDMQRAVWSMDVAAADGLGKAAVPVLLTDGAHDALVKAGPPVASAIELNPRIRASLYDASGHAPFLEEADRFNRDLSGFIDGLER